MFRRTNWLDGLRTNQLNYGVAVSDVDHDGKMDWIVAGYSGQNFVLRYNNGSRKLENIARGNTPYEALMDTRGRAIGVTACDIDGDGKEEIYFLNTNGAYSGRSSYGDKLFKWRNGRYEELYSDDINRGVTAKDFAGRSVACVDRKGTGKYSIVIATYGQTRWENGRRVRQGLFAMVEMDDSHPMNNVDTGAIVLRNVAAEVGIERGTGGRGIVVGPIIGEDGRSDIFFGNEGNYWMRNPGNNFLFENLGNGTFRDIAGQSGVADANNNVRGVTVGDYNRDGLIDIAYGNWNGPHRLFLQNPRRNGQVSFSNVAGGSDYETATRIRTVISADFDNDGNTEFFMNNIGQPNKLFTFDGRNLSPVDIGRADERRGHGTGAAVADMDGDGKLDLLISHGESTSEPLSVYRVRGRNARRKNWIRVMPKTLYGAPARGALVKVTTQSGRVYSHVIDGGSGYLCEMEPFAHVGLGSDIARRLVIRWPDGQTKIMNLRRRQNRREHVIDHPRRTT
ncbi:hypothetical protein FSP39_009088 [Pinctada imbricata]|uniref:ASPIC/UnbV domain-containing protein n=1 Tax=Pinctada imbricata TaxID=66713 RepID=A0AA88XQY1_PINIB|nr:hypothetical protein FSP39_009088 [Pinctada imbricata]